MTWLAASLALAGVLLLVPPRPRLVTRRPEVAVRRSAPRGRAGVSLLAGCGAFLLLGGALGAAAGAAVAATAWLVLDRAEPTSARREREGAARDLPHLVELLASGLRAGAAPEAAVRAAVAALPGPAADRLGPAVARLALGVAPADAWAGLVDDEVLAPLGRTLARAATTGSSVTEAVERLAEELDREARAAVEDRARSVGVKAAVPLGACLLPAFLLLGIVPSVAGLLESITP